MQANKKSLRVCPDCADLGASPAGLDRRAFLRAAGGAALIGAAGPVVWNTPAALAAPSASSKAETAVARFYQTLSDEQKKTIVFPFDHELRNRINANWHVTKQT